ncbi:SDR family oxidoreductase [Dehalobacter sp. DCM]|uniref:glucose 1-dehydrogenase n=1 Tax=Dehalobacter sp. DCM TaxID=2907827 RepID=UPI003081F95E|nr:SDR family oxidoreductase [Dehalobacter sp. DCM]UWG95543.1 SDR family oxidoreductase [Dehalobacter sp. DCM]
MRQFDGKVALITGAATGIGRVTAQMFAREGARVVVTTGSNVKGGEETVELIKAEGGEAIFFQCDVSKADQVEAMVKTSIEAYGRLDFAFNNAGIGPDGKRVPIVEIANYPEDLWNRMIDINLTGVFLCMKYEIRQMLKQGFGAIVNTSSVGGLKVVPGFSPYTASKSGLIYLTKVAALEYAKKGIRINVVLPGPTGGTLLMDNLLNTEDHPNFETAVPIGRVANPEECGASVIWLCSDAASFVTGVALPVDGGLSCY